MKTDCKSNGQTALEKDIADICFTCEGKCRLCPFPGANCAREEITRKGENNA